MWGRGAGLMVGGGGGVVHRCSEIEGEQRGKC